MIKKLRARLKTEYIGGYGNSYNQWTGAVTCKDTVDTQIHIFHPSHGWVRVRKDRFEIEEVG